jgi:hypothetical protein
MARNVSDSGDGLSRPDGAGSSDSEQDVKNSMRRALGRRALLGRGGVVAAGVVGAGAIGAVAASSAGAAAGDPVLQDTVNNAGSSTTPTELDASNNTAPAFILTNTGVDSSNNGAGPQLRLTQATGGINGPFEPTASTTGGDLTATADGSLWFTHNFVSSSGSTLFPAPVHTEATANVYAGLATPSRVLDTRTAAGRSNIINASGNVGSTGLLTGKTIFIDLGGLVTFADNVIANFTVTGTTAGGFLTVWDGAGTKPATSNINWTKGQTIANLTSCVVGAVDFNGTTFENVIAIFADTTTHVLMDVLAFTMPGFEFATGFQPAVATNGTRAARLKRAQAKLRAAKRI